MCKDSWVITVALVLLPVKMLIFLLKASAEVLLIAPLFPVQLLQKEIELGNSDASSPDEFDMDEYDDLFSSPSLDEALQHATLIATLAECFKLTSFKPFQREIINATLQGKDSLIIQPTVSGKKSLLSFSTCARE